jgi:hypothetical protein
MQAYDSSKEIYVTQHPPMHHPLKTTYDSVVDDPFIPVTCKVPPC